MRALIQRVKQARVTVSGQVVGEIGPGLVVFVGVGQGDSEGEAAWLAEKIVQLRIFEDEAGKMNRSLREIGGAALIVSQFTLYANTQHGRRPSFIEAALPEVAAPLVERFASLVRAQGVPVAQGIFGAEMLVEIHNDGPVTIWLEK
ncbi:MAG: D-aminoacyl-tRNA deacylase [Anaerolineales bacterium]